MTRTIAIAAAALLAGAGNPGAETATETAVIQTVDQMTRAFAEGDIDRILTAYAPGAVVVGADGARIRGDAALREMFASYIDAGATFSYGAHEVVISGDTALHLLEWRSGEARALSVAVLKRQPDGGWRMVIDHPFGDNVMHAE